MFSVVFWLSSVLLGTILLMTAAILLLRIGYLFMERSRERFVNQWQPLFNAIVKNQPVQLPPVRRVDAIPLLEMWVEYRSLASPEIARRLEQIALELNLEGLIEKILRPTFFSITENPVWLRNMAMKAVQWLPSQRLLRYIYGAAESENLYVAVSACACLTKLRAPDYEQALVMLMLRFPEHSSYIAIELDFSSATEILQLLEPFVNDMPADTVTNFVSLADYSWDKALLPLLVRRLENTTQAREVALLIRTIGRLGDGSYRTLVKKYLIHERYYVRLQAIKALGRIGTEEDIELIRPFLTDSEWWIRYRAARAIIRLMGRDQKKIKIFEQSLPDRFARDIIKHAFTEMEWCVR